MIRYCEAYWNDVDRALESVPCLEKICGESVFITGGTGMIGSAIVELLFRLNRQQDAGIKIILGGRSRERVCERFVGFCEGRDFLFLPYDATKNQDLEVCADYFIHGASNANPAVYTKEPVETILANVVGLHDLLSTAYKNQCKRLLYISSSEVYGTIEEDRPYTETDYGFVDILNPRAAYPCAKRTAETLCVSYGLEHEVDTAIVRPGHIYGPSITATDSRASAQFTRNAARGEDIVMKSAGMQLRSYCYTLDCASAVLTVLLNGECGNAYNISNRESVVTISEVAQALAKSAGQQVVFQEPSEQEKQGYNMMMNSSLNAEKLEALGWKAVFDLKEGTEKTVKFYLPA